MLVDTKPTTFDELIRISGLSHGTDVWLGNAKTLIDEKTVTLTEAICCRDDIMIYLIKQGLPPNTAFKIMETVRKRKGFKRPSKVGRICTNYERTQCTRLVCKIMRKNKVHVPKSTRSSVCNKCFQNSLV